MQSKIYYKQATTTSENKLCYPEAWIPVLEFNASNPPLKPIMNVFFSMVPLITKSIDFLFEFTTYIGTDGIARQSLTRILYFLSPFHTPTNAVELGTLFTSETYLNSRLLPVVGIDTCEYNKQYKQLALAVARENLERMKAYCSDEDILELKEYLEKEKEIAIQEDKSTNDITTPPPRLDTVSASSETTFSEETLQPEVTSLCETETQPLDEETPTREATPPRDAETPPRETTPPCEEPPSLETSSLKLLSEATPQLEAPLANKYVAPIIKKQEAVTQQKNNVKSKQKKKHKPTPISVQQEEAKPMSWSDWATIQRARFNFSDETKHKMLVFSTLLPLNWVAAYGLEASGVIDRQELWNEPRSRITANAGLAAIAMTGLSAFYISKSLNKAKPKLQ